MKLCVPHATFQSVKTFFRLKAHRKEKTLSSQAAGYVLSL